jgi:hypothetical protein
MRFLCWLFSRAPDVSPLVGASTCVCAWRGAAGGLSEVEGVTLSLWLLLTQLSAAVEGRRPGRGWLLVAQFVV